MILTRVFAVALVVFAWPLILEGQNIPKICDIPAYMTKNCIDACLICDIDGFTGINNPDGQGQLPPGFCTSINHNVRWIAFMASTPELTLEVRAYNCRSGPGLEIGIFESLDCKNIQQVSNCDTDVRNGETVQLKFTKRIVEGQYYYLVIDGNQGDVCTYSVKVVEGSTKVSPLDKSGTISGELRSCQGNKSTYQVSPIKGATWHFWYLNGKAIGSGMQKEIEWSQPGTYQLCAQAVNACDDAPPNCIEVLVSPSTRQTIQTFICKGQTYTVGSTTFSTPGKHTVTLKNSHGCDSIVELDLSIADDTITFHELRLCEGDTIQLGNKSYSKPGIYLDTLKNKYGCDSIVDITIAAVRCLIHAHVYSENSKCYGESTGKLHLFLTDGTPPFFYYYENLNDPKINGVGQINQLNQQISISDLPTGDYRITISDFLGNQRHVVVKILEPPLITYALEMPPSAPFTLLCNGDANAFLKVNIQGGTPPYQYYWAHGDNTPEVYNLGAGKYELIVRDKNECPISIKAEITEPPKMQFNIAQKNPSCDGKEGGSISILDVEGGVPPYKFTINGGPAQNQWHFGDLGPGHYAVTMYDANRCSKDSTVFIKQPALLELAKIQDYLIELGDNIQLNVRYNRLPSSMYWYPADSLSCLDCVDPLANPTNDTYYTLYGLSEDGCRDSVKIHVRVLKSKKIWAPNVFSPNGDGINDRFKIYGNKQLLAIRRLQIYSRWGELVFEEFDTDIHSQHAGWDGTFRGRPMNPGVFAFIADLLFVDNTYQTVSGDFTLVK